MKSLVGLAQSAHEGPPKTGILAPLFGLADPNEDLAASFTTHLRAAVAIQGHPGFFPHSASAIALTAGSTALTPPSRRFFPTAFGSIVDCLLISIAALKVDHVNASTFSPSLPRSPNFFENSIPLTFRP